MDSDTWTLLHQVQGPYLCPSNSDLFLHLLEMGFDDVEYQPELPQNPRRLGSTRIPDTFGRCVIGG